MLLVNCTWTEVKAYIDTTRVNADREKNALGFLPPVAYEQAAKQGNLFVATENGTYAGHLFFGGTFPHAKIFQLYVNEAYRGRGVALLLLRKLESDLEKNGFLTISASVAADLPANGFWEKAGFSVLHRKEGGISRRRTINVRVKDLDTPHLFKTDQHKAALDLIIASRYFTPIPVYVLDLNVFWDVVRNRPRSEFARQVIGAALDNFIQIVITQEFLTELRRTTRSGETDPALEFALQLPALPMPPETRIAEITAELAALVFPMTPAPNLSDQDRSDLIHLTTAIHHRTSGFLTSDDAIVNKSSEILAKFGLEIFPIKEFAATLSSRKKEIIPLQARVSGETLKLSEVSSDKIALWNSFLDSTGVDGPERQIISGEGISRHHIKRLGVTSEDDTVCLAYWDSREILQGRCTIKLLANEEHPACETALDSLLNRLASEVSSSSPVFVEMEISPGGALARKAALLQGFKETNHSVPHRLGKMCVGRPITSENFAKLHSTINQLAGLSLPKSLPAFSNHCQLVSLKDANDVGKDIELAQLERILSPVIFVLPNRTGVLIPIQRVYAEQLFGTSAQMTFIPGKEAILFSERIYLSSPRNLHTLVEGSILLFYESGRNGGAGSVIAVARCLGSSVLEKGQLPQDILRRGVVENSELDEITVNENIAVTRFDNVMLLPRTVPLLRLRDLGCVDGSNLITARRITDEQTATILGEGYQ
ncbi:MAG: GNAT family N-acetyltransferase [Terriglobales bacterium]